MLLVLILCFFYSIFIFFSSLYLLLSCLFCIFLNILVTLGAVLNLLFLSAKFVIYEVFTVSKSFSFFLSFVLIYICVCGSFMYNLLKMNQHLIIHVQFKIFLHCPIFVSVMLKKQRCWNKDKTMSYMLFFFFLVFLYFCLLVSRWFKSFGFSCKYETLSSLFWCQKYLNLCTTTVGYLLSCLTTYSTGI